MYLPLWVADFGMRAPQVLLNLHSRCFQMTPVFLALKFIVLLCYIFWKDVYGDEFVYQLWGQKLFSAEKHEMGQVAHHTVISLALSRWGTRTGLSACTWEMSRFALSGEQNRVVSVLCTRTGCNMHFYYHQCF